MTAHLRYFRECFRIDNAGNLVDNIFQHQYLQLLEPRTFLATHNGIKTTLAPEYASALLAEMETYRREKSLIFGSAFIAGFSHQATGFGKAGKRLICSPLFYWEPELTTENQQTQAHMADNRRAINASALAPFIEGDRYQEVLETLLTQPGSETPVHSVREVLREFAPQWQLDLCDLPLESEKQLKSLLKEGPSKRLLLISGSALVLIKQGASARGVLDELGRIIAGDRFSAPLSALGLSPANFRLRSRPPAVNSNNLPAELSAPQQRILEAAREYPLSVLIGPPGTGKSFTIACLALERMLAGESVLIAAASEHAVDVVRHKLLAEFHLNPVQLVRVGDRDYHRQLKQAVDSILALTVSAEQKKTYGFRLWLLHRKLKKLEQRFADQLSLAEQAGALVRGQAPGIWQRWRSRQFLRRLSPRRLLYDQLKEIQQLREEKNRLLARHINHGFFRRLDTLTGKHRKQLQLFRKVLGARTSQRQSDYFSSLDFSLLQHTMPVWLGSLKSLHRALPLEAELFDLVIIDEATQSDIASCLPALQRARRAVIVGDPKQLRHFSFISRSREQQLCSRFELDPGDETLSYRQQGMIEFALNRVESNRQVATLDEHYRSQPKLIEFNNREFYDSQLKIMTGKPGSYGEGQLTAKAVDGHLTEGINAAEADAILTSLSALLDQQQAIPQAYRQSIGIMSYFRQQAEYLQQQLVARFTPEQLLAHQLKAGTPYSFQGEERDIMLISCGVDDRSSPAHWQYLNRADVFNVATSRARVVQTLFYSFTVDAQARRNHLLLNYLRYLTQPLAVAFELQEQQYKAINDIIDVLTALQFRCTPNLKIAGTPVDLVIDKDGCALAIDLIGFAGGYTAALAPERYKIFERAGTPLYPISFVAWQRHRDSVIQGINKAFTALQAASHSSRLASHHFGEHWSKLLVLDYQLAEQVKILELELLGQRQTQPLETLGDLIDAYLTAVGVLNKMLNTDELTYIRYTGAAEKTLRAAIKKLARCSLQFQVEAKAGRGLQGAQSQLDAGDKSLQEITKAIDGLNDMACHWAALDQSAEFGDDLESALEDMAALNQRVPSYRQKS